MPWSTIAADERCAAKSSCYGQVVLRQDEAISPSIGYVCKRSQGLASDRPGAQSLQYDMHATGDNQTNLEPGDTSTNSMRCARTYSRRVELASGAGEKVFLEFEWYTDCLAPQVSAMAKCKRGSGKRRPLAKLGRDRKDTGPLLRKRPLSSYPLQMPLNPQHLA